jgi:hypothetical protein
VLVTIDAATELEVVERREEWVEVRYDAWRGWIDLDGPGAPSAPESLRRGPDPARVGRARELCALTAQELEIAGYRLLSDVEARSPRERIGDVLRRVDGAYRTWFGLEPGEPMGELLVVYARRASYRALLAGEPTLGELDPDGFAGGGMAVVHAEDRQPEELSSFVVHEMVHLLNRRATSHELPVWLEEGLATALAWARLDEEGRPVPETFWEHTAVSHSAIGPSGRRTLITRTEILGPRLDLARLLERHRRDALPSLRELVDMPASAFLAADAQDVHYGMSAALVRFLLDGDEGRWRDAFHRFLAAGPRREVTESVQTGSDELAVALGSELQELETRLWRWLARLVPPELARHAEASPRRRR